MSGLNLKATSYVGIGYVANIPATFLGVSSFFVSPRILGGMGLYADFKRTTRSPGKSPYYLPTVSVMDAEVTYGDRLYLEQSDWTTINTGLLYAVTKEFAFYGGLGYAREKHYRQYYDQSGTRGEFGYYWVADPAQSGTRVNAMGGGLIRLTRFALFQLGAEARPAGANVGLSVAFHP
ncbi:MAG TPA: hypothetical protein VNJ06_01660 [Gemmatimonadales bacterium]|nr:hypothetical protein [Gemmatimonadales bacterium]